MRRHRPTILLGILLATSLGAFLLTGCTSEAEHPEPLGEVPDGASTAAGPFDPTAAAPPQAELFAPAWIASPVEDRDAALSPDGSLFLFSRMGPRPAILVLRRQPGPGQEGAGVWGGATMASFSGLSGDLEPAFSPDGSRLWFASERPAPDGEEYGHDLWWVSIENTDDGTIFGEPQRPGAPLNTEGEEFYPSLTREGAVYFTTTREGGVGVEDIWRSRPLEDGEGVGWSDPECLGPGVNTASYEFNAYVAPDESYLLFTRWMREGDFGGGDLYVSFRRGDGTWTEAQNLGAEVNTAGLDYCPFVSPDGETLFFTRKRGRERAEHPTGEPLDYEAYMNWALGPGNGAGDIYWVSASLLDPLKQAAFGD
jgi:hypothetical protein